MEASRIYSAVYSGVPVFEMVVNSIAVMRRRTDSYMNATQILKVANIDKGKRTKILEKEVLIGEHEKVQGGYGKYQGTWIPCPRSKELAERYHVYNVLRPLFEFDIGGRGSDDMNDLPTKEQAVVAQRKQNLDKGLLQDEQPIRKKIRIDSIETYNADATNERNREILMSIFVDDDPQKIPQFLKNFQPKSNFNINIVIDEQGHTALHWAASLARTMTVELLVSKGANINCTSYEGETPLMRSVMVTNSYKNDSFPSISKLLLPSITLVDNRKRNVLHHAVLTGGIQSRKDAAIYYIKHILKMITMNPQGNLILDAQDSTGDTPLSIAARLDCKEIIDLLVESGATQNTENNAGLISQDYQSNEREESQVRDLSSSFSNYSKKPYAPSHRGKEILATVQKIVDALDEEYGDQLASKDQEVNQIQNTLNGVTEELETTRKALEERQAQSQKLSEAQQKTRNIEIALAAGRNDLNEILKAAGKPPIAEADIDKEINVDALFEIPDLSDESMDVETLRKHVMKLQSTVGAYTLNDAQLSKQVDTLKAQFAEKEMQCKRLIAACCNLPVEKIDDLVEPLILAIESDPPDLDLTRVIGFMDKIRRQGTYVEPIITTTAASPTVSSSVESPATAGTPTL
ncbi:apses-domain-containing protein [Backusella circina FSU 941]|nr:apses-domain-containing protein [Backusella circina FSU 941]